MNGRLPARAVVLPLAIEVVFEITSEVADAAGSWNGMRRERLGVVVKKMVNALRGGGAGNEVIAECLRGTFLPLMGTALFTEYETVLRRPAGRQKNSRGRLLSCRFLGMLCEQSLCQTRSAPRVLG